MLHQNISHNNEQEAATPSWWQKLKNAVSNAYTGIINAIKSPFQGLTQYFTKDQNPDATALLALRKKHFDLIQAEDAKTKPDFVGVAKLITADTKNYMQNIIDQEIKKLGKPPCKHSFVTLGSMAREECGPVTDLEIGILYDKKDIESYQYFAKLSQNISDRLFLLGEHPDIGQKGLRMDEADNAPPHLRFFARNATPEQAKELLKEAITKRDRKFIPYEGSRPYLATPEEFADYSKPEYTQNRALLKKQKEAQYKAEWAKAQKDPKNKTKLKTEQGRKEIQSEINYWLDQMYRPFTTRELAIANQAGKKLGRNMAQIHGDKGLYQRFDARRKSIFAQKDKSNISGRQKIAKEKMVDDIKETIQKGKSVYLTGKLDKTLEIKRELYRFAEQFVTNLGFYHQCKSQNTLDIVKELQTRKILSSDFANNMSDFIQFASGLRLKEQRVLGHQSTASYLDQKEFEDDKAKLEKEMAGIQSSYDYMIKLPNPVQADVDSLKRKLDELKYKHEHLLEMAPGKIISPKDLVLLKNKYLPIAQDIFKAATSWTQGQEKLGFDAKPAIAPVDVANEALNVRHGRFSPLNLNLTKPQPAITAPKDAQEEAPRRGRFASPAA
jgi:hypothetical protein